MEQHELHQWEAQCTQEEAPHCQSQCPLHIDIRTFCKKMAAGKMNEAWAVLYKSMPMPHITANLCNGACMETCLRKNLGGSINMPELERCCAANATKNPPVRPLPSKNKRVLIIGGGLTALAAAWDLAKKGITPTILSKNAYEDITARVPEEAFAQHEAAINKLGVQFSSEEMPDDLETACDNFDVVLLATPEAADLYACNPTDSKILQTNISSVFSVPSPCLASTIERIALGRTLALSAERSIQNVSLTAGRETEGSYASRLQSDISSFSSLPLLPASDEGYDEATAMLEAGRCMQCECMQCVNNCVYLAEFKSYPKIYARQIYNNAAIVMGTRHANKMINSCMLCGLCEEICPESFAVQNLCLTARQDMVADSTMPPSAHEFALRDMAFANTAGMFAKNAPSASASSFAFFPGCQLPAISPHLVESTYAYLRDAMEEPVGLFIHCCGAPAHWAGQKDLTETTTNQILQQWEEMGKPELITGCPTCATMLATLLPQIPTRSLWEVLEEVGLPPTARMPKQPYVLHDPCSTRYNEPMRSHVRSITEQLKISITEPHLSGSLTECCGYGGLLDNANPQLSRKASQHRADILSECTEDEQDVLTYCAMCRDMLARTGKRTIHLLDILFPSCDTALACCNADPATVPVTGFSDRRENRMRLKEHLLKTVWGEAEAAADEHVPSISYTEQAAANMEERRILRSDIRKVVDYVEATNNSLFNTQTRRYVASFRPVGVTYWMEYIKDKEGYRIHNAWSHRMQIIPPK
ncbi:pyridine nucleotide-disulfide oxidoreductase/dicluster-binding protein [Halodesulfovibrio marinisediminis]|uniref:Fe-S oxidoreductase n=1 Tax=Halodesulfovibrio marinisediminis DSM 17456 TaxID=1121457 RepID=A0A1N6GWS7_9BACT|nr:pyridine nucleotide-disulfide oxidoreductase/dicluster-binding protein [Halodesulfovibrio marinisediminis]SIO11988.1 Fe-S oxidoreductase [Halodesulfovibrio marinisediminis DSM 17456]